MVVLRHCIYKYTDVSNFNDLADDGLVCLVFVMVSLSTTHIESKLLVLGSVCCSVGSSEYTGLSFASARAS